MKTGSRENRHWLIPGMCVLLIASCSGDQTPQAPEGPRPGPSREANERDEGLFGTSGGVGIGEVISGGVLGGDGASGSSLPVNKFLWQASLDTLSFLPLASTDPFTGVIATDWGTSPADPRERFKVTAYMVRPALAASSLKVAVYRELRNAEGLWVPAPVDPETARKLEDAIIVRARQIRIADLDGSSTG
ncbi:MAG: DUF3576 domain-containing protein [Paracoccaceae bacterium]